MEMFIWNTAIVISKVAFYAGFACIAGYAFFGHLYGQPECSKNTLIERIKRFSWLHVATVTALFANTLWFFANTGAMAEEGLSGAVNVMILDVIWGSSIGDAALVRTIGLVTAAIAIVTSICFENALLSLYVSRVLFALSLIILSASFPLLGHVSELGMTEKFLLALHVFIMSWWFGALYLLKHACRALRDEKLYQVMKSFGNQASAMVSLLLVAGLWLATQLVGEIDALWGTTYGRTLMFKVFLVIGILAIAARHKLRLVPLLKHEEGRDQLSKSIGIEIFVAFAILTTTAALTSIVGPVN